MKLLELLVKERIEWHPEALCYTQDSDDMRVYAYTTNKPDLQGVYWGSADVISGRGVEMPELADDWQTAIVTKEQYDNACKLVDDGYTLWFGGECPVEDISLPSVVMKNGEHNDKAIAVAYNWDDVIAYKDNGRYQSTDVVNHPSHYTNGKVECIDAIESATVGKTGIEAVCVANVIKYLWRYEDKNGLEDIKKAQWYLNKLIEVKK